MCLDLSATLFLRRLKKLIYNHAIKRVDDMTEQNNKTAKPSIYQILSLVFGIISVSYIFYNFFIADKDPKLAFKILSNTPVFNVNEKFDKVKVLVYDTDIQEQGDTLSIVTVKLINNSSKNLTEGGYDTNNLPRLIIENGDFISEEILDQPSYIENVFKEVDERHIVFNKMQMDSGDFVLMKFLIEHPFDSQISFITSGRIIGQNDIPIRDLTYAKINIMKTLIWVVLPTLISIIFWLISSNILLRIKVKGKLNNPTS